MIAIIPIFFEGDQKFWLEAEGKALLLKSVTAAARAREIEKLFIFSSDKSVIELSQSFTKDPYLINIRADTERSELLPPGTYSSLEYLQKTIKAGFEDFIILGFRNPLITPDLIDEAINKFKISIVPALISVKKSIDHPCQLNAYYRIVDVGFIHFFDEDQAMDPCMETLHKYFQPRHFVNQPDHPSLSDLGYKITKPFHFDWGARGVKEKNASLLYCLRVDDTSDIRYIPVDQNPNDALNTITFPLWVYDGPAKARIIMQFRGHDNLYTKRSRVDKNFDLAGAQISDESGHTSSLLLRDIKDNRYVLAFNLDDNASCPCVLRALPVGPSDASDEGIREVEINDFSEPISFQHEDRNVCGIIYSLLKVAEDGTYDLCEPFPPDQRLWTGSAQKINVKTGKEIMGRQDFPDVLEPEGTFFIMKKDLISSFDREVLNGNADGFVMEDSDSIQIKSSFDLLRYRAITRATEGC